jgi:acetolactate synthase-1/2/3 large subunit
MATSVVGRFAQVLKSYGIDRAYGLPGEDHMPMLEAFEAAGIKYMTVSNESSAVIMAATDSLVSGKPGVAIVSMATGVSNAINGVLHAYMEGAPVLLVSGRWTAARESLVVRQGFEPELLVKPCTKWTVTIRTNQDPAVLITKAIDIATSDRPGPVYIELPDEIAVAEVAKCDDAVIHTLKERLDHYTEVPVNVVLSEQEGAAIAEKLAKAKRPVVVLGGRYHSVNRATLEKFATTFHAPVFTSPGQKGVVTEDFDWFAGAFLNGNPELAILKDADFILALNPEGFDILNRTWPHMDETIVISTLPLNEWVIPFKNRKLASPEAVLLDLLKRGKGSKSEWKTEDVKKYQSEMRTKLLGTPGTRMSVVEAVDAALRGSPKNTRVTADAGFSKPLITMLSKSNGPRHFLASNALSTMGYGIPASIGAAEAADNPVLGFMGDGSLLMRATELVVTRYLKNSPVFVVIVDKALSQIEIKQERRKLDEVGIDLPELSCQKIGESMNIKGVDVHDVESLENAVRNAFKNKECTLIGAHVDPADSRRLFEIMRG